MLAGRAYLTPAAPADWKYLRVAQVTGNPGVLPIPESQPTKNCHEYLDGRAVNLDATLKRQQRTQYLDAVAALGRARTVKRLIQEGSFESQQLRNASTLPQVLEEDEEPIKNGISGKRTHPSGCYSEAKPIIALADPGKAQNRRPSHGLKPRSRSTSLASITSEAVYGIFVDMDDAGVKKGAYTTGLIPLSSPSVPNMSSSSSSIKGKEKEVSSMDDMTVQGSLFSEQLRNAMSDSVSFQESFLSYPEYLEEPYMDNNFRHSSVYTFQEHDNHTSSLHRTTSAPAGASFAFQPSADTATTSSSNLLDNPRRGSSIYRRSALHGDTPLDIQTTHVTSGYTVIFGEHTSSMSVSDLRASTLLRDLAARHALESPRKLKKSESYSSEAVHNHKRRGSEPDSEEETVEDNGSEQPSRKKTKMEHVDSFPSTLKHDVSSDSLFATRDLSEYRPGSIVRVTLKNFVTYDSITFTPGPHLNMIIGPNGTGKSTIVCAIALGLGGSTSLLGRAKDISDFVKTGKEKATIEIEIKSSNANRSPIKIKRQIKRASNASVWKINGENATHKEVLQKVAAFNIQVDNLCQFLPQDKVVEFAQMTPSELLRETQKAAGAPELSVWHDQLIEMKKKEMTSASRLREKKSHLANLEQRNNLLERDVLRFQQRQKILRQIQVLKTRILYVKYGPLKEAYNRTKAEARALKLEYEKLKESVVPEMNRLEELQALPQTLQAEKDKVSKEIRQKYAIMKQASKELEELEETADSYRNRMKARKKRAIQQRANIEDLKKEIALLEERVNQSAPPEVDLSGFTSQLQEINREIRKLSLDRTELQSQVSDIEREGRQLNEGINKARKGLANLDNVRTQRLERLRQQDPQTAKAYEWLEANRDRFEAAVYGPPLLELNVKNLRYADAIETLLGGSRGSDLKLFIFESKRDYEKFRDTVVSPQNLRISYVWLPELRLSTYQPPCSREQLREFGMDCFALDVLEGPEPILSALCERQNLHTIPLASRSDKTDPERIVASKLFKSWVIGDETYRYRSAAQYSSTAFAVTTRRMRRAEVLAGTVNLDEKQRLQKELDDKLKQLKENEMKIQGFADEINALRDKDEKLRAKKAKLNEKRKALSAERESFERSKVVLENKKQSLQRLESQPEEAQEELRTLQAQLARTLSKRCFLSEQYVEHSQRSFMLVGRRTELHLEQIQAMAELTAFEASCQARESEVVRMKQRLNDKTAENQQIKADATTLRDQINAAREELEEDELLQLEKELSEEMVPVEELERLQAQEEAKADSMYKTNPQVLREYERRKVEIENMCAEVEKDEEELTQAQTDMTKIKDKWAPALEELVKRISTEFDSAFRKIGCVGEVKIDKQEDFEAWGIDILVKFRDAEKLQKLTGQRQSGGERSVSTISYLMALQASARSPFRVVDEINQGMDPRNERLIHRQLVDVACQLNTPQYFLITPKLLPDLYYHERMKVLCINNGEWLPSKMSWQRYFANRK